VTGPNELKSRSLPKSKPIASDRAVAEKQRADNEAAIAKAVQAFLGMICSGWRIDFADAVATG
jgi:hypothetical protein